MKILVLSDSHSAMRFMYACMGAVKPDAVIHLGDHYDDGAALAEDFPSVRFYQVPETVTDIAVRPVFRKFL